MSDETPWRGPTVEAGEGADILSARILDHLDDGEAVLVVFDEGPRERLFVPSDARLTRIGSALDMSAGAIGPTSIDPWRVAEVQRYDGWGYTTTRTRHRYGTPVEVRIRVAEDVGEADAGDRKVVHDSLLDALGNAYEWDENAIPDGGEEITSVSPRWTLPEDHYYGRTVERGPWHIFDDEERRSLCGIYNDDGVTHGSNRGLEKTDLPGDVCGSCVGAAPYLELYEEETREVRGVELPLPLAEFAEDDLSGLFAVRSESEGVLYYDSCSRVGGRPAVEIPFPGDRPHIVDESGEAPNVVPPRCTFDQLVREYGLVYEIVENHAYVYVPEDR